MELVLKVSQLENDISQLESANANLKQKVLRVPAVVCITVLAAAGGAATGR